MVKIRTFVQFSGVLLHKKCESCWNIIFWWDAKKRYLLKLGVLLYVTDILENDDFAKMIITAWGIWYERNKKTHGQQQRSPQQTKEWVISYFEEVRNTLAAEDGVIPSEESSHGEQAEVEI